MNINNPFEILKNAQKIQEQFGSIQERLKGIRVMGASGGGMVEIELDGKFEMLAVRIAPETMAGGDTEMLQDLIMAAFADGMTKVKEAIGAEIGSLGISGIPVAF
jgi:DNA-binding YbaB/EbfC family protein